VGKQSNKTEIRKKCLGIRGKKKNIRRGEKEKKNTRPGEEEKLKTSLWKRKKGEVFQVALILFSIFGFLLKTKKKD
jgi:hypothetical protein